jgi:GNAT superfamily N-acetyltransferase
VSDVRRAGPEDASAIAGVQASSWKTTYRGLLDDDALDRMTPGSRLSQWEQALGNGLTVFVGTEDEEVVAFCSVAVPPGDGEPIGEITAMYALERAQGRGHGRRLMEAAIAWFRARGCREARLWVLEGNRLGRSFYEKAGWRATGEVQRDEVFGAVADHVRYAVNL